MFPFPCLALPSLKLAAIKIGLLYGFIQGVVPIVKPLIDQQQQMKQQNS